MQFDNFTDNLSVTDRRRFLGLLGTSGAALVGTAFLETPEVRADEKPDEPEKPVVDFPPVLQCPTETGVTVVWAVKRQALGAVQFGLDKDKLDQSAYGEILGLKANDDRFLQVRIDGLEPNKRYFYRTVTTPLTVRCAIDDNEYETRRQRKRCSGSCCTVSKEPMFVRRTVGRSSRTATVGPSKRIAMPDAVWRMPCLRWGVGPPSARSGISRLQGV